MSARSKLISIGVGAVVVVVAAVLILTAWLHRPAQEAAADQVSATVPVPVEASGLPKKTSIGVILTLGSSSAGSEQEVAAQGAVVAAERLRQGGTPVTLVTRNDRGSTDGAEQAVKELKAEGVSGIVITGTGDTARSAAGAAERAGLPALLPYVDVSVPGGHVFSTAPTAAQVKAATARALSGSKNVLLLDAGGETPAGLSPARTLRFADATDVKDLASRAAYLTGDATKKTGTGKNAKSTREKNPSDAVVLSADSQARAALITRELQAAGVSAPIVLGPGATSPAFTTALVQRDGAVSGQLVSVAGAWGDSVALRNDSAGRAMSAFLSALRMAAADEQVKDLTGDAAFAESAWAADSRSHDAVMVLAQAAAQARSTDPAKVTKELTQHRYGAAQGVAGPAVDLTEGATNAEDELTPVYAADQDLGLRPASSGDTTLVWVPAPQDPASGDQQ